MQNRYNSVSDIVNISRMGPRPTDYSSAFSLAPDLAMIYRDSKERDMFRQMQEEMLNAEKPADLEQGGKAQSPRVEGEGKSQYFDRSAQNRRIVGAKESLFNNLRNSGYSDFEAYAAVFPDAYKQLYGQRQSGAFSFGQGRGGAFPMANEFSSLPNPNEALIKPFSAETKPQKAPFWETVNPLNTGASAPFQRLDSNFKGLNETKDSGALSSYSEEELSQDDKQFVSLNFGANASLTPDQRQAGLLYAPPANSFGGAF